MPGDRSSKGTSARVVAGSLVALGLTTMASAQRFAIDSGARSLGSVCSRQVLTRMPDGTLYALSVQSDGQLRLQRRGPRERRFSPRDVEIAGETSGVEAARRNTDCSLVADSKGVLHILWAQYHYPEFFAQHYRRYDPETGALSPVVKTSHWKAQTCGRSDAMALAVDAYDNVYLAAPTARAWKTRVLRVAPGETRAQPEVTDLGHVGKSWSSQRVAIAVDAHGRLHCAYYSNANGGVLRSVVLDGHQDGSRGAWSWTTTPNTTNYVLARSASRCVFAPQLACDENGAVHMAYVTRPSPTRTSLLMRTLPSESTAWRPQRLLAQWDNPARAHDPNNHLALALRPDGSRAYLAHRLFEKNGEKRRAGIAIRTLERKVAGDKWRWVLADTERIEHRSLAPRRYWRLHARFALYPESMHLHGALDVSYALPEESGAERLRFWRVRLPQ